MSESHFHLALIGYSADVEPLLRAMAESHHYRLAMACHVGPYAPMLRKLHPLAELDEPWEALLHGTVAHAVLVANDAGVPERDELLRKLAQHGVPMLAEHPACDMLLGLELLMIQRDTQGVIVPYVPGMLNPALEALGAWKGTDATPIGAIQQCVIDAVSPAAESDAILHEFARDVLLARAWLEPVRQISALGPSVGESPFAQLSVQMATQSGALVRWNHRSDARAEPRRQWTMTGNDGTMSLTWTAIGIDWVMDRGGDASAVRGAAPHAPAAVLQRLEAAVRGKPVLPSWEHACRALELQDSVPSSIRRGKTIDLHLDEISEEKTFKAMMASGGCLLLMLILGMLPLIGAVQAVVFPNADKDFWQQAPWAWFAPRRWPLYLAAGLLAFLALQFLRLVFRSDTATKSST